jgi:hypothetical protein
MDMIRNAVTGQLHGKPVGAVASWTNSASQNSGLIRLVKKMVHKGQNAKKLNIQ